MSESLSTKYFNDVYAASDDPWSFETSDYEAAKYADTLASLPAGRYRSALEIGCSIGVLTQKLAERCDHLLATDVSEKALVAARRRCAGLPGVDFQRMQIPVEFPDGMFDLTMLSEVGYYWNRNDLTLAASLIRKHMTDEGLLVLVHWTPVVPDYPLTGDQVHDVFLSSPDFTHLHGHVRSNYRLDIFCRGKHTLPK